MQDSQETEPAAGQSLARSIWWLAPLLLLVGVGLLVLPNLPRADPPAEDNPADRLTITLQVDDNNGPVQTIAELPWSDGMTVGALLRQCGEQNAEFTYTSQGEGERAFLSEIQGVANEGAGPTARNWMFYIGGQRGDRSYDIYPLRQGDVVLWKFETYE